MSFRHIAVLLALALAVGGCSNTQFHITQRTNAGGVADYDQMQHYFISGIGQESHIDVAKICGGADKVVRVETEETVLNGLLAILSWGLYTPQQARVYCSN